MLLDIPRYGKTAPIELFDTYLPERRMSGISKDLCITCPLFSRVRTDGDDQVALVWIFDTIHQCLICHTGSFSGVSPKQYRTLIEETVYYYVITNFDNPTILTRMVW